MAGKTLEESGVLASITESAPNKAPDPEGYTMTFYQKAYVVIKHDIMVALQHFH